MNIKIIIFPFLVMAAVGSALAVITHFCCLLNMGTPWAGLLGGFLFMLWIPVVIVAMAHGKEYSASMKINIHNYFGLDNVIYNCLPWMKYIAIGLWPYFLLMLILGFGIDNENYIVSSMLIIFYFNGFCILYSYMKQLIKDYDPSQ
jgi:hypothetical protein